MVTFCVDAAGYLNNSNGSLNNRGTNGNYWSSTQNDATNGWNLNFNSSNSNMNNNNKAYGFSLRCLRDSEITAISPVFFLDRAYLKNWLWSIKYIYLCKMNEALLNQINQLSEAEKASLTKQIERFIFDSRIDISVEESDSKNKSANLCPHCQSSHTRKNGFQYGVQRFVCNDCKKNFRYSTGMATVHLKKKEYLKTYIPYFLEGYSLEKCAKLTGICKQTSFDWRHKILATLGKYQDEQKFSGILEADEMFFEHSEKGNKNLERTPRKRGKSVYVKKKRGISNDKIAVVVGCDRKGNKVLKVATKGRISTKDADKIFEGKVESKPILCTDGHRSYEAFAKSNNLEHHTVKVSAKEYVKKGIYHVQHVNQTASELNKWMRRFNGVSTKYLQNYLNWFAIDKLIEESQNPLKKTVLLIAGAFTAYNDYSKIIDNYNILIRP